MSTKGHMNYFSVDLCGLYKVGSDKVYGCELNETFDLIQKWVKDRRLQDTIPWDPNKDNTNKAKFYCKDIHKDVSTGDFFVVLWKSDTDSAGTLWGAQEDNETGSGKVVKYTNQYIGKKVIWGRPSYYWIIPEYNLIISIKFDFSVTDAQLFEQYVKACINNRVKHEDRKKEHTEKGYVRISYIDKEGQNLSYRFEKKLKSVKTLSAELQHLSKSITHIIRRETIIVNSKEEHADWVKIFNKFVPLVAAKPKSKKRKIEVRAEARPSAKEIKKIIETNAIEDRGANDWENVGFQTDDGVTWVDRYRLRNSINIVNQNDKLLGAKELCKEINRQRAKYLEPLHKLNSAKKVASLK